MPRRRVVGKREVLPDPKFGSSPSQVHEPRHDDGKKSIAEKIVYGALDIVSERSGSDPLESSKRHLKQLLRWWVSLVALAALPIRCPLKFGPNGEARWLCDSWWSIPGHAAKNPWFCA